MPWLTFALTIVALGAVPLYLSRARRTTRSHAAAWTAQDAFVIAAIVTIAAFTGRPGFPLDGEASPVNLRPFSDLFRAFDLSRFYVGIAVGNLVGNVLLFVPLGLALALRFRGLGILGSVAIVATLSVAVEGWQAVAGTGRNADITDVLMNTLGGAVGHLAMRAIGPVHHPRPITGTRPVDRTADHRR